jgi:hypothetical protein
MFMGMRMRLVAMIVRGFLSMVMLMGVLSLFLAPEFLARQLLFAGNDHVRLGRADAAAVHTRDFQAGVYSERFHGAAE